MIRAYPPKNDEHPHVGQFDFQLKVYYICIIMWEEFTSVVLNRCDLKSKCDTQRHNVISITKPGYYIRFILLWEIQNRKFTECSQILLVGFQIEAELVSFQTIACMGWVGWGASMHPCWPSTAPCSLGGPHWINDKEKFNYSLNTHVSTRPHQNALWYNSSVDHGFLKIRNYVPKDEQITAKKLARICHS